MKEAPIADMSCREMIQEIKRLRNLLLEVYVGVLGYIRVDSTDRRSNAAYERLLDQGLVAGEGRRLPYRTLLPFHVRCLDDHLIDAWTRSDSSAPSHWAVNDKDVIRTVLDQARRKRKASRRRAKRSRNVA